MAHPQPFSGDSLDMTDMLGFEELEFADFTQWADSPGMFGIEQPQQPQPTQQPQLEEEEEEFVHLGLSFTPTSQLPMAEFYDNLPTPPLFPSFVPASPELSLSSQPSSPFSFSGVSTESESWGSSSDDASSPTSPSSGYTSDAGVCVSSPQYEESFRVATPFVFPQQLNSPKQETINPSLIHPTTTTTAVSCTTSQGSTKRPAAATKKEPTTRKRARKAPNCAVDNTSVTLPRDKLLQLTSEELDTHIAKLRATRQLTPAEEKDIGRQKRLVKNRESASLSRLRRKEHLDELEQQVSELTAENGELRTQVEELTNENNTLKERLSRAEPQSATTTAKTEYTIAHAGSSVLRALQDWTSVNSKKSTLSKSAAAAGACLAIILFSFGLFFNSGFLAPAVISGTPGSLSFAPMSATPTFKDLPLPVLTDRQRSVAVSEVHTSPEGEAFKRLRDLREVHEVQEEEEAEATACHMDDTLGSVDRPISCDDTDSDNDLDSVFTVTLAAAKRNIDTAPQSRISTPEQSYPLTTAKQNAALSKSRKHDLPDVPQFHVGEAPAMDYDSVNNPAATPAPLMPMPVDTDSKDHHAPSPQPGSSAILDSQILRALRANQQQQQSSSNSFFATTFSTPNVTHLLCPQARPLLMPGPTAAPSKVELDSMLIVLADPAALGYSARDIVKLSSGSWTPPPPGSGVHTLLQVRTMVTSIQPLCYSSASNTPVATTFTTPSTIVH
eukprot:TRINITY_DN1530_c0_g1_i1.p1 TRINITY_DN1530_c0_g1~~TRINITY_DN1530_c0_g1_i1.p1  ORF type:complete len:773 (-),score=144.68 TRINITY_DN1530_c0_g1_i1:108-2288(-)